MAAVCQSVPGLGRVRGALGQLGGMVGSWPRYKLVPSKLGAPQKDLELTFCRSCIPCTGHWALTPGALGGPATPLQGPATE